MQIHNNTLIDYLWLNGKDSVLVVKMYDEVEQKFKTYIGSPPPSMSEPGAIRYVVSWGFKYYNNSEFAKGLIKLVGPPDDSK